MGGTTLATSDFFSTIDFSTAYSSEYASWDASGTNDITLNSTANTDIQNDDAFICAIVEHDKDYSNTAATSGTALKRRYRIWNYNYSYLHRSIVWICK